MLRNEVTKIAGEVAIENPGYGIPLPTTEVRKGWLDRQLITVDVEYGCKGLK